MSGCQSCSPESKEVQGKRRTVLWIALILNALMFFAEVTASFLADSLSLRADAIDFLGDAANYGVSLFVLGLSLRTRAFASIGKASSMGIFGLWVIGAAVWNTLHGSSPGAETMGLLGLLALAVNVFVAFLLYRFRDGDSNMQSVWLCSRNDAIGNVAVMIAAGAVHFTSAAWPDLIVAVSMGALSFQSGMLIFLAAQREIRSLGGKKVSPCI